MKKINTLLFVLLTQLSFAQQVEITPFGGYTFKSSMNIAGGRAGLQSGATYGGLFSVSLSETQQVSFMYSRHETIAFANSTFLDENFRGKAAANYVLIGATQIYPDVNSPIQGFLGLKIGMGILSSLDNQFNTVNRFALGFTGGVKYFVNDMLGIMLSANLNYPVFDTGASVWWSPGSGTQVGVSGWSPLVQFGFNGGIILRLNGQ